MILFGMTGRSVVTTVCNGKVLMKDRELLGIDEEKVLYEVRESGRKSWHNPSTAEKNSVECGCSSLRG